MANNIKGITVQIGGDTGPLNQALSGIDGPARKVSAELTEVNRQLKYDPKNTELLTQKQDLLAQSAELLSKRQAVLKDAVAQAQAQFEKGDLGADKVRAVEREYQKVTSQLKGVEDEMNGVQQKAGTLGEKIKAAFSSAGSAIKENIGKVAGMALGGAAAGLTAFAKQGIELATNLTEVQNVVETTFGKSTASVNKFAESAGKSFGISQLDAEKYTSTIGAMFKSMGLGSQDVVNMSEKMTGLAGDMASFYNLDPSEAFEKIRSGISGETEPLKQLGINMDVANLSAFAMSQGITTAYDKMSQSQQVQLRYNYLLSVTKDAQGDYAKTANSAANQQRTLKMEMEDMSAKVGTALLPVLNQVLSLAQSVLQPVSDFVTKHPQLSAAITGLIIVIGGLVGGMTMLSGIMPFLTAMFPALGGAAGVASVGINMAMLPVIAITAGIVGLIAIIVLAVTHFKQIKEAAQTAGNGIKGAFTGLGEWFSEIGNSIKSAFANLWNWLKSFFTQWGPLILTFIAPVLGVPLLIIQHWGQIVAFFTSVGDGIKSIFSSIEEFFSGVMNGIKGAFSNAFHALTDAFSAFRESWENGFGVMQTPLETFFAAVAAIGREILNFFLNVFAGIKNAMSGPINSLISAANKVVTGIKQVFSGFATLLKDIFVGPWLLIADLISTIWTHNWTQLRQDTTKLLTQMSTAVHTILQGLYNIFAGIFNMLKSYIILAATAIVAVPVSIFRAGVALFKEIWMDFSDQLKAVWNGMVNVGKAAWNALLSAGKAIFTALVDTIKADIQLIIDTWNATVSFFWSLPGNIRNAMNAVGNAIRDVWNGVIGFLSGLPGTIGGIMNSVGSWIRSVWDGLVGFIGSIPGRFASGLSALGGAVRGAFDDAIGFIRGLPGEAMQWGRDIIDGIVNGIKSAAHAVGDAVNGVAQNIRSFLHFSEPDTGPLKGFHSWWKDMMYGMADDINSHLDPVRNAVRGVAATLAGNIGGQTSGLLTAPAAALTGQYATYSTSSSMTNAPVSIVNFNGSYGVQSRGDVDYMMNQAAIRINRKK